MVPNPFQKTTLTIRESKPHEASIPETIEAIAIRPSDRLASEKPDLRAINEVLDSLPRPRDVKLFEVHYDSRLPQLPKLQRFTRLQYAHIGAGKARGTEQLHELSALKSLFIVNIKQQDFDGFAQRNLAYLRLIRGRIGELKTHAEMAFLQSCSKLERFDGGAIKTLWLEGCHQVQLESLGTIEGLEPLRLLGRRTLKNFDWLTQCRALDDLTVTATTLGKSDIAALCKTKTLRKAWLSAPAAVIKTLGAANRDICVTNGSLTFENGVQVPEPRS